APPERERTIMLVGFIGLGTMGGAMALNVRKAGYDMIVYDLRREAGERHVAAGCRWADSPGEVAQEADVIFTSLPGPREIEAIALDEDGLLAGMKPGAAWFDLSTSSPTLARRLHPRFAAKNIALLDAPVSGGPSGANSGRLAIWVGGEEPVFDRHKPLLDAIGDQAAYIGPIGAGSIAKLVHNCAGYAVQTALAEVFTMGVKAGVEPLALWEAIRQGAQGRARTFDRLGDEFLQNRFDPPSFALRLAHKDVTLAVELGKELGVPMRLANLAREELTEAVNRGWGDRDSRVAMLLQEERAGVEIEVSKDLIDEARSRG
ncbi:MAG: NAD(P)-dependent oxidoreductase, partial [Dehalococcoidia bacterium]